MFERMKGENDVRKNEIHGLKDILVRENEKMQREQVNLDLSILQNIDNPSNITICFF